MRRTRVIIGIALMLAGPSAAIVAMRVALGDQARARAAIMAAVSHASEARDVQEQRLAETQVLAAARIEPLAAGIRARVDGATLVDMFDNEDWWRPYRVEFPSVRVVVDGHVLATRGPDLGPAADELAPRTRAGAAASAMARLGDRDEVVAAAPIPDIEGRTAILVLGRPTTSGPAAPAEPPAAGPPPLERNTAWALAGALCLGGLGLVVSARRRAAPGSVPQVVSHETTFKFGTPARPRAVIAPPKTPAARSPITDGRAISISTLQTPPLSMPAVGVTRREVADLRHDADPSHFGRYRLVDRLGEGGMSELFVAEAAGVEGFTRSFVLKRLRRELAQNKEAVAQFIDEARMQASLVHSNIVPVFDFGVVGGEYFMTQEYIVGRDLSRLVMRHGEIAGGGLPETLAYYIAHETLQALTYAHDKHDKVGSPMGIVHRDVSSGNIMVSLQGEVKLSDFGIVKSNRRVSQTQVGMVKGNANFMSPEQARGQAVDPRSDLFSLAHVLYYSLTGRLIYTGENDLDVLYRAAGGLTDEDFSDLEHLPEPARGVLTKALAFDPAERFQTAAEFADALAAHTGGGKSATARLMRELFAEELQRQTTREAGAV